MGDSGHAQHGHSWWYAHSLGGAHYKDYHGFDNAPELVHKTEYVTDYYTSRALEFLDQYGADEQPFCLSLHYTAPHTPWSRENHHADIFDSYAECQFESIPREEPHPWHGWNPTPEQRQEALQGYFAAVTGMDNAIARVLARLEALGLRQDTIVVFMADNGFNLGHHGIRGKGNGTQPMNMYEESVMVPFIVSCPGRVPQGSVEHGLYSQYDFMPTILDFLDVPQSAAPRLPGRSFAGVLRGQEDAGGERVVVFDEYGPARMIRDHQWKYVHRYVDGPHELYDLQADPGERVNLADEARCAATVAHMRGQLEEWFDQYADPDRDGALLPVTGSGQIDRVGAAGGGRTAFV
jgi:choline-sulfatase